MLHVMFRCDYKIYMFVQFDSHRTWHSMYAQMWTFVHMAVPE